jgi:hypothetical protein
MAPFDLYPHGGRQLFGVPKSANARHEYVLKLMRLTGQRRCAYCGADLTASYQAWLTLVLDHVIPVNVCKSTNIPNQWCWDYSNTVLACSACNGFCNRYIPTFNIARPDTLDAFYELRDRIFGERKTLIAARHEDERLFFDGKPWERH